MSKRNYSEATRSALFALSTKCYFPPCKQPTVTFFGDDPEKKVDIAHIHAVSPDGPRYLPEVEVDAFPNLILLCGYHHKKVDKRPNVHRYPADLLREWKAAAEKDLRSKIDGLDRLTEHRLSQMLQLAADRTKSELTTAIDGLQDVSEGAAEILRALLANIETHYLDADAVAALEAASYRLINLEDNAASLYAASRPLRDLEDNAHMLLTATNKLDGLEGSATKLLGAADALEQVIDRASAASSAVDSIEHAGRRAVDQIQQAAASVELVAPTVVVVDPQRWKFFSAGVILSVLLVITGIALRAKGVI
ncbi:hypothetical protein [Kribbella sp. NBC_00359]|uniref:hypothetical protein n=1 Tax=Kribbella sp. NBC_00359 TaxID=2975966 RepID=UPI002E1EC8B3